MNPLVYPKEPILKGIALVIAVIFWVALLIGTVGAALLYLLLFYVFYLFAQSGLISHLRGAAVRIDPAQMPDLHGRLLRCCDRLGIAELPEAYLLHGNGVFNAFATRFRGRNFIVLFSDVVDALEAQPGAIDFYIGHELGHIKQNHLRWAPLLAPALFLPLLGAAYSRAREYSCDQHGLACCETPDDALRGIAALAAGHERWKSIDLAGFGRQAQLSGGFWMSFHELVADYPWLSKRMGRVAALAANAEDSTPRRNPLAWLLAAIIPRIPGAGAGGFMIVVATIGILAAIAIPAYQDYIARSKITAALVAARPYQSAIFDYLRSHKEWPASSAEFKLPQLATPPGLGSVDVGDKGVLTLKLVGTGLEGKSIVEEPVIEDGRLNWRCHGQSVPAKWLPPECR